MEGKDLTTINNIKDDCVVSFLATVKTRTQVRAWTRNKSSGKILTGILMDKSGSIDFVCWTEGAIKFDAILKENCTYKICKAKSVFAKESYSRTKHICQIILDKNSEIEQVESEPLISPVDVTPIAELASKENQQKVSVVGKVLSIPNAERLGSTGVDIVKVRLQDNSGTIQLSLMGNEIKNGNFSINDIRLLENIELRIYGMLRCLQGSTGIRTVNPSDRDYTRYLPGPNSPNIDLSPGKSAPKEKTVFTLNKDDGHKKILCSVLGMNLKQCTYERDISNKTDNYMFVKNLRVTAAYWKSELSKLMAKIRSLGPPTFFMSLSANDIHWIDNLKFINPMLSSEDIMKMSTAEKMKLIKENPIASSIHFNNRWEAFLKHFLLEKPYPLGNIVDYFARIEFQVRGSPHLHILLWIADAPNFENENERDYIVPFLDAYISAQIPDETDQRLKFLVTSLQTHSHTMSCQRSKKVLCRFDFPMPISDKTRLKTELDTGSKSRFYLLHRSEKDIFVNAYNKDVLQNWEANMDLQFIGSMHAVAKYVCAYICKNEPFEFRQKIQSCIQKLPEDSTQRKLLSKIGNILLTHRTIGLQETAYRLLGLNMVYSSRESIYVDVNIPEKRYRILKSKKELDHLSQDSISIYYDGLAQYYLYRPHNEVFENKCLAEFVTKYKTTSTAPKTSKGMPRYTLEISSEKKLIMQRSKLACLQCYIPDMLKDEEGYYYSLLYLFLPFRNESQILTPYKTYMEAFRQKKNHLNQQLLQLTKLSKKFDNAVKHLLRLDHDHLEDIICVTAPSNEQLNNVALEEGLSKVEDIFSFDISNDEKEKDVTESDFNVGMFKKTSTFIYV